MSTIKNQTDAELLRAIVLDQPADDARHDIQLIADVLEERGLDVRSAHELRAQLSAESQMTNFERGQGDAMLQLQGSAIILYNKSIKESTNLDEKLQSSINKGLIYAEQRKREKALSAYDNVIRWSRNDAMNKNRKFVVQAHTSKGIVYEKQGYVDQALDEYDQALLLADDDEKPSIFQKKGLIYEKRGEGKIAINEYNNALTLSKENDQKAYLYLRIGINYMGVKNKDQMMEACTKALELAQDNNLIAKIYMQVGLCQKAKGKRKANFKEALQYATEQDLQGQIKKILQTV